MTSAQFSSAERSFLNKVMQRASLTDIYDARDITTVVFRTLRDMMPAETSDRVEAGFSDEDIAQLWKKDNPIVNVLRNFRSPLDIDTETFLRRIRQEAGVPKGVTAEAVVIAVFSAVREELPAEQAQDIANILPDGLKVMWEQI
jgi:uncharacterized protein (DUF2267 family)